MLFALQVEKFIMAKKTYILWSSTSHCYSHKISSHIWRLMQSSIMWRITRNNKTYLAVSCGYPVTKEYIKLLITLSITDEKTLEIAFVVVTSSRNSLEIYINTTVENPPHQSAHPLFNWFFSSNLECKYHKQETSYLGTNICEAGQTPSYIVELVLMNNVLMRLDN